MNIEARTAQSTPKPQIEGKAISPAAGFTLFETVATLVMVSFAMGAAAMVLSTGAKVAQQRTQFEGRSLEAANCMARMEAAFEGRPVADIDRELAQGKNAVCGSGVQVSVTRMKLSESGRDNDGRRLRIVPDEAGELRLVTVTADKFTYSRLFAEAKTAAGVQVSRSAQLANVKKDE